ncbi:glycerate kinase type-2 family protein [Herpetosiphon giganteus]|uniref:glycerate kinase type-2 family protein n=1 Tax=Herpetosiphon giganteus TaxID=2029754 RepID=UPI001956428B|nr:DUF4147 domain-containing protein [Herpetosiphon giganteus]MBM7843278.1 hydroxypyruvate reductase [Herpetosiphon giganteus]
MDAAIATFSNQLIASALAAVEPQPAVLKALDWDGTQLRCGAWQWSGTGRIIVLGAGKAGAPMAAAVEQLLGNRIAAGLVVVKDAHRGNVALNHIELLESSHPTPDQRGLKAAQQVERLLKQAQADDLVLALISGGASALLPAPAGNISLADLQQLTQLLLACGAPIEHINLVRKHCDRLKGGQFAALAQPASLLSMVISDVVGSPLSSIASGLSVPDSGSFAEAWAMLEHYQLQQHVAASIRDYLQAGIRGVVPAHPNGSEPWWPRVQTSIVARNETAQAAVKQLAQAQGWQVIHDQQPIIDEAQEVGAALGQRLRHLAASAQQPTLYLAGGETTVNLAGIQAHARGGRNAELALAAALALDGCPNCQLIALATDGGDGSSPAAGAIANGQSIAQARRLGLEPQAFLANHDSYGFWQALGSAIDIGPTLTNVNDLVIGLVW